MTSALITVPEYEARDAETITGREVVQSFMDVLTDPDCRAVLAATTDEALTAREVSEHVDLPMSTTYRKLDALSDAGLLAGETRFDSGGSHPSQYQRVVDDVIVSVGPDDGATLTVIRRSNEDSPLVGRP